MPSTIGHYNRQNCTHANHRCRDQVQYSFLRVVDHHVNEPRKTCHCVCRGCTWIAIAQVALRAVCVVLGHEGAWVSNKAFHDFADVLRGEDESEVAEEARAREEHEGEADEDCDAVLVAHPSDGFHESDDVVVGVENGFDFLAVVEIEALTVDEFDADDACI